MGFSVAAQSFQRRRRSRASGRASGADGVPIRIVLAIIAILFPNTCPAQDDVWTLEVLEQYASWVRDSGFACPLATRITEVGPADGGAAFKVACGPITMPITGEEVAFRLTVRPDGTRQVESWRE